MAELIVQIQPERLPLFEDTAVETLCSAPAFSALIQDTKVRKGQDKGAYINVHFTTDAPKDFWPELRQQLVRLGLQGGSIVTCTGKDGWNDYLLLHHYDPSQAKERLSAL